MATTREVRVQSIQDRSGKAYAGRSPFVVRWVVGRRQCSRAFATKRRAEVFRGELLAAIGAFRPFDTEACLPVPLPGEGDTAEPQLAGDRFVSFALEHFDAKWEGWKASSRRGAQEGLIIGSYTLVDEPLPPGELRVTRAYLKRLFRPADKRAAWVPSAANRRARAWLEEHSLPVAAIRARHVEAALGMMGRRLDGGPAAVNTLTRRRQALNHCLKAAARAELCVGNPVELVPMREVKQKSAQGRVNKRAVPSLRDGLTLVEKIAEYGREGQRYSTFFLTLLLGGLRPSEAAHLGEQDLMLPESGWGEIAVHGGTVVSGKDYTGDGAAWSDEGQKWREEGAEPRTVPIPPRLVAALRAHLEAFPAANDRRVFTNRRGNPLTSANTGKAWRWARGELWPLRYDARGELLAPHRQHPFSGAVPYTLRHTNASTLISHMPDAEAARRLGHSLEMLRRVYASWFEDDAAEGNASMDAAFGDLLG
ncbi:MAG: site-specific integrase [Actinomycetota bacterium]|nr:site-specific integrase [Actinomycetota bacterium]